SARGADGVRHRAPAVHRGAREPHSRDGPGAHRRARHARRAARPPGHVPPTAFPAVPFSRASRSAGVMRILFLVSGGAWNASARAFLVAAKGLSQRGHDIVIACESECPVHVHAQTTELPIVPLRTQASGTADGWRLRDTIRERAVDAVFVHTDAEQYVASSAVRFARGAAHVIRRIPPFAVATRSRRAAFASRLAPTALLFTTDEDRESAANQAGSIPATVAPLSVDL